MPLTVIFNLRTVLNEPRQYLSGIRSRSLVTTGNINKEQHGSFGASLLFDSRIRQLSHPLPELFQQSGLLSNSCQFNRRAIQVHTGQPEFSVLRALATEIAVQPNG